MNNNQDQMLYEDRPTKAADFRRVARNRLKGFWWTAILVTLIASLLGGVAIGGASFNHNSASDETESANGFGEEQFFTPEQAEAFEKALENDDLDAAVDVISEASPVVGVILSILGIILIGAIIFAVAFNLFVSSPIKVGYQRFFLEVIDGNEREIRVGTLFRFFKQSYGKTIGLNIIHSLIMAVTALPMLICTGIGTYYLISSILELVNSSEDALIGKILIFAGLILLGVVLSLCISIPVSYSYSMAHMIMADYPSVGAMEALRLSRQMMKGNKFRLWCLDFSFIGWYLLGSCACGLGGLVVTPYQYAARAAFYHEVSNRRTPVDVEFPSVNPDDYMI